MRRPRLLLLGYACAMLAACSGGGSVASTFSVDTGGAGAASGGGGSGAFATASASSSAASSAQSSSASSSAASSSSASVSSSSSSSSSSSTGGPVCDYTAPDDCSSAVEIPSVSGDTGNDVRTVSGTTAEWFMVHVTEDSDLIVSLSYTVTLDASAGVAWDLYVYTGDSAQPNCFAAPALASGSPESFHDSWPDNFGSDDGRWIVFEIRYVSGSGCGPAAQWTLTLDGDT